MDRDKIWKDIEDENLRFTVESEMARLERITKRLWIVIILQVILFAAFAIFAFVYQAQFMTETTTYTQEVEQVTDRGGTNNFIGGDYNGNAESENH